MITNFEHENKNITYKIEKYKKLTTLFFSFDTYVNIATTSSSSTLSITRIG